MKYRICQGSRIGDLAAEVETAIKEGWQPIGGAFYVELFNRFYQTMIKQGT